MYFRHAFLPLRQHGASKNDGVSTTSTRRVAEKNESDGMPRSWLAVLLATHSTRAQTEAERTQQLKH